MSSPPATTSGGNSGAHRDPYYDLYSEDSDDDMEYQYEEPEEVDEEVEEDGDELEDEHQHADTDEEYGDDEESEFIENDSDMGNLLQILRQRIRAGLARGEVVIHMGEEDGHFLDHYRTHPPPPVSRLPEYKEPVPSPAGRELMASGEFGVNDCEFADFRTRKRPREMSLSERLLERETRVYTGARARLFNQFIVQPLLPTETPDFGITYNSHVYSGQFSEDGNFFYSCSQDMRVRMYDTSNPYSWKYYKTAEHSHGSWTITDATLSPDNKYLAYSSLTPLVYLANTSPEDDSPHILNFSQGLHRGSRWGVWSVRFSGDGSELVAGTGDDSLVVYDLESQTPILRLAGHTQDVNAVCYGDRSSPHILYSGSDDATIKIWDRRSMASGREVGVFPGHLQGITYIDSKGDGRYILSNGKDQTMKLWDIRSMMSPGEYDSLPEEEKDISGYEFDYRYGTFAAPPARLPSDRSVVTYRGHEVLRTLIRCHFSPQMSTGGRYVYSGSADGKIAVWNMDATRAKTIETRSLEAGSGSMSRKRCRVRDVSWHPTAPVLAATAWCSGSRWEGEGLVSVHSWAKNGWQDDEEEEGRTTKIFNTKMVRIGAMTGEQQEDNGGWSDSDSEFLGY